MTTPTTNSLSARWQALPESLRALLRLGFVGKLHLLDVAGRCLRAKDPALAPVAADALHAVIREHPLDGDLARELLAAPSVRALLPPETVDRLALLAAHWRRPEDHAAYLELQTERDADRLRGRIARGVAEAPDNLFWREQAIMVDVVNNDPEFIFESIEFDTKESVEFILKTALERAKAHFAADPAPEGEALLDAARRAPWNAPLALRAHDLLAGAGTEGRPLPGSAAVLLYSWNKADELDATLASLAASDLSGASLFVLDNGSTDRTPTVLADWSARFAGLVGADRFTSVTLPVNIGAAAARNWLLHLDAVRAHDFLCYLDDDVVLPQDWLALLGAAAQRYPEAGVWGCKVVDQHSPRLIQSADSHLLAGPSDPMDLSRMAPNPFRLSDLHIQTLDHGAFDFLRPCASVTGCCHLFRTATLLETGDFAIQLSPSQYDDMEHDLRLCEAGLFPVYQGHLAVRHRKRTGAASRTSAKEAGNALGNKYKMQTMHAPEAIAAAAHAEQQRLEADLLRKLDFLDAL